MDQAAGDPVRDEAQRLAAAVISALSNAARGAGLAGYATGSAECCVCPLCRVIAAVRDPDPDLVTRLASGAGDIAAGVANLLRDFGGDAGGRGQDAREGDEFWESMRRQAQAASAGSADGGTVIPTQSGGAPMAKKAVKKAAKKAVKKAATKATGKAAPKAAGKAVENAAPKAAAPDGSGAFE